LYSIDIPPRVVAGGEETEEEEDEEEESDDKDDAPADAENALFPPSPACNERIIESVGPFFNFLMSHHINMPSVLTEQHSFPVLLCIQ
jgi:hypothetical protein